MQTYVVTGGSGFLGSHIVGELLKRGDKVICVDNLLTGSESNIQPFYENNNFIFIDHDVIHGMPTLDSNIDGIFHFASPASPNEKSERSYIAHPIETLMVNSLGTKHVLDLAKSKNARVVYASSSEVYGDPAISPQVESYFGNVNPNGPRSVYDEAKRFGEAIVAAYHRSYKVNTRTLRIFNTYGPRMQKDDGRVVSNFICQALNNENIAIYGDGSQTRSFCYVDDLVEGIISAMDTDTVSGKVINLGNPEEYTILELAHKIIELTNSSSEITQENLPKDDPKRRKPDISLARELLNYEPKVTLEEGLKKTIEYFKSV